MGNKSWSFGKDGKNWRGRDHGERWLRMGLNVGYDASHALGSTVGTLANVVVLL